MNGREKIVLAISEKNLLIEVIYCILIQLSIYEV